MKNNKGLTLVEVMIWLSTIGLLASLLIPHFIISGEAADRGMTRKDWVVVRDKVLSEEQKQKVQSIYERTKKQTVSQPRPSTEEKTNRRKFDKMFK